MKQLFMLLPVMMLGLLLGIEGAKYIQDANVYSQASYSDIAVQQANVHPMTNEEVPSPLTSMSTTAVIQDPLMGTIVMFGGNFAPRDWAFCDGQLLSIAENTALFSILGTTYGGDGRSTFGLPDLRQRVPVHAGNGPGIPGDYRIGQKGGIHDVTLAVNQIPSHFHMVRPNAKNGSGDETNPANGFPSSSPAEVYAETHNTQMGATQSENTGGGLSHNNVPPFTTVNYIIALQGVYPSRN